MSEYRFSYAEQLDLHFDLLPNYDELIPYVTSPEWLGLNPYGEHGVMHSGRVLLLAELGARRLNSLGSTLNLEALRLTAQFHDVMRSTDHTDDLLHGFRSAQWAVEQGFIPRELQWLFQQICEAHSVPDDFTPFLNQKEEVQLFRDADALDRVRGPFCDYDRRYIRVPQMRQLEPVARTLFWATELNKVKYGDSLEAVLQSGLQMGVILP